MANFTDSVVAIIHNALVATRQALEPDNDPQAKEIIKMIVECERILSGSSSQAVGTSSSTSTSASNSYVAAMNRYFNKKQKPDQSLPVPMGAAASATVIQKTKALFSMFHPTESGYYEPEPIGGSASVSIASKIVAGHKVQKTKALFEMFHLT